MQGANKVLLTIEENKPKYTVPIVTWATQFHSLNCLSGNLCTFMTEVFMKFC